MRLDKFLKVSRLIKRRTVAKDASDGGAIKINDRPAKASSAVKEGDILEISLGSNIMKVKVLKIADTVKKEDATEMYEIIAK